MFCSQLISTKYSYYFTQIVSQTRALWQYLPFQKKHYAYCNKQLKWTILAVVSPLLSCQQHPQIAFVINYEKTVYDKYNKIYINGLHIKYLWGKQIIWDLQ